MSEARTAGQVEQRMEPVLGSYFPPGHSAQLDWPVNLLNLPAEQLAQALLPVLKKLKQNIP
jgi:hypothetical protein